MSQLILALQVIPLSGPVYSVLNGVRQGVFSRQFCSMCILMIYAKDCNIMTLAVMSEQKFTRALDYADDLTLLSPFLRGLQKVVDICNVYVQEYSVKFYWIETQCMCIKKIVDSFKVIYIWREKKNKMG